MNRERLEILSRVLKTGLPEGVTKFNMNVFVDSQTCGYAACALGAATFIPEFREQGFIRGMMGGAGEILYVTEWDHNIPRKYFLNFKAAEVFFDLDKNTVRWLFCPNRYGDPGFVHITPAEVGARIDLLLSGFTVPLPSYLEL